MSLKRTRLSLHTLIRMVPHARNQVGIWCAKCNGPVDYEALVEGEPNRTTYAKILYRCHGEEDMQVLDMGTIYWTPETLSSFIRRLTVFTPDQGERTFSAGREREEKGPAQIAAGMSKQERSAEILGRRVPADAIQKYSDTVDASPTVILASERWAK